MRESTEEKGGATSVKIEREETDSTKPGQREGREEDDDDAE